MPSYNQSSLKQRLIIGGTWALLGKCMNVILILIITSLVSRLLSTDDMGVYFLSFSIVMVCSMIARLGLDQTSVRIIAEKMSLGHLPDVRKLIYNIFFLTISSTFIISVLLFFWAGHWIAESVFSSALMEKTFTLWIPWIIVTTFQFLISEIFRGLGDIRLASIFGGITSCCLTTIFFLIILIFTGKTNLYKVIYYIIVAGSINLVLALWILKKKIATFKGDTIKLVPTTYILSISTPLLGSNLLSYIMIQAPLWIIGIYLSKEQTALFGAANRLAMIVGFLLIIVNAVLPPFIAELNVLEQKEKMEKMLQLTAAIVFIPALILSTIFIIFGKDILEILFGLEYRMAGSILTILCLAQLTSVWVGSCDYVLMMTGQQKNLMVATAVFSLATVAGTILVVNNFQTLGVTCIASLALIGHQITVMLMVKHHKKIWTFANMERLITYFKNNKTI